jgi:hypothetical protein
MTPTASIVISSFNRLHLFRRSLWAIANRPPSVPFEVVVCDDGSTEDVLGELKKYSSRFEWTFVRFDQDAYEKATGQKKFFNNSSASTNVGVRHSRGEKIFWQGNEVLALANVYDRLLRDVPTRQAFGGEREADHFMVMSTTYDVPQSVLDQLDEYGTNFSQKHFFACHSFPLQSKFYRSDVTNYVSLSPRSMWDELGGVDERYYAGYGAEDSDFVQRARTLPGFTQVISEGVSLHQNHGGRSCYQEPSPEVITLAREDEGRKINRKVYDSWTGQTKSGHSHEWGTVGVGEVISNWK